MLALRDLHKRFGAVTALDGVSFEVPRGRIVGFLGPNGAGKTTTMRSVFGLVALTIVLSIVAHSSTDILVARSFDPQSMPSWRQRWEVRSRRLVTGRRRVVRRLAARRRHRGEHDPAP